MGYNEKLDREDEIIKPKGKKGKEKRESCKHSFAYMSYSKVNKESRYVCILCGYSVWC